MNVHRPAVFLVIFALCLVAAASTAPALALAPPDPTAPPGWTTSCIYCPKRFDAPGEHYVAIDAAGHPHLAYGGDALYYALRDEAGWHTEIVDSTSGTGGRASLALAPGGTVGIAYYSRASGALMFARRVGQAWETETVDLEGDLTPPVSLAADSSGRFHIAFLAWRSAPEATFAMIKYAYRDAQGWHRSDVTASPPSVVDMSLAVSPGGMPHIAYRDEDGALRYVYRQNDTWQSRPPIAQEIWNGALALALDTDGMPHILYSHYPTNDPYDANKMLDYAHPDGDGWTTETVDTGRPFESLSLLVDGAGLLHAAATSSAYSSAPGAEKPFPGYAWYAWRDANGWHLDAVEQAGYAADLALNPQGEVRFAFFLAGTTLNVAQPGPLGGWHAETVDTQEALSGPIALAVDRQGKPQVAYRGDALYHAVVASDGWQREAVLSSAGWQDLAVDSLGQPHLAAVEQYRPPPWQPQPWSYRLWYATEQAGEWQRTVIANEAGHRPAIAVDGQDRVHLAYIYAHPEAMDSELVYLLDSQSTVLARSWGFASLSLAVDSQANPRIVHMDGDSRITYQYFDGTAWWAEPVGAPPEAPRFAPSLALDAAGQPAVAYVENLPGMYTRVLFAVRTPAGWAVKTVLQEDFGADYVPGRGVGEEICLVFDTSGKPHLVFVRDGQLQHGWRGPAGWQFENVDPSAVPAGFDLAAGTDGRLLVAYIDSLSNDARLAELAPRPPERSRLFLPVIVR